MANPAQHEIGAQLQQKAREKLQGTDAMIGGTGEQINVSADQSKKILSALTGFAGELQTKKPEDLTETEMHILSLVGNLGPKGKIDGKQACQALLLTNQIAERPEDPAFTGTVNDEVRRQAQIAARVAEQIALEVIPREANTLRDKYNQVLEKVGARVDKTWEAIPVVGRVDQENIRILRLERLENHPIIKRYKDRVDEIAGGPLAPISAEHQDKAMREAIKIYGDSEVDKIIAEVQSQEQRREKHREKEEAEQYLTDNKEKHEENVTKQTALQEKNKELADKKETLQTDIDVLQTELDALPAETPQATIDTLQQEISNAQVAVVTEQATEKALQSQLAFIKDKITNLKGQKSAELYDNDISTLRETTINNLLADERKALEEAARVKGGLAPFEARFKDLSNKKNRTPDEEQDLIDLAVVISKNKQDQGAAEARAEGFRNAIKNVEQQIKDLEKYKGQLTPADLGAIEAQSATLNDKIVDSQKKQEDAKQKSQTKQEQLNKAKGNNESRSSKKLEIDKKKAEQRALDRQTTANNSEIASIQTEVNEYHKKEKVVAGAARFIEAADKAAEEIKKIPPEQRTVANIRKRFNFEDPSYNPPFNNFVMAGKLREVGHPAATTSWGSIENSMKNMNEFDFWRFLMTLFAGAEVS